MTEDELLTAWRAAIAATDAAMQRWQDDKKLAHYHAGHHDGLFMTLQRAEVQELRSARAYLAAIDRRAEEPHAAHSGAPLTSRRECGCIRVQCDVCMEVLRDTYCSLHGRAYLAARDAATARQVTCSDAGRGRPDFEGDSDVT